MPLRPSLLVVGAVTLGVVLSSACGSSDPGAAPDSGAGIDASVVGPDAAPPGPDAAVVLPDGAVVTDATVAPDTSVVDAAPPDPLLPFTVQVGPLTRSYGVRVPKTYDPAVAYPVVMLFHGEPGNQDGMYAYVPYQAASGDEAILVYLSGDNQKWDLYTPTAQNKDIAFLDALLVDLAARYTIDTTHVFGFGYSNGAYFVNQVACRRSSYFRGIASNAGGAPYEPSDPNRKWPNGYQQCPGQTAVASIGFHDPADPVVGYDGGEFSARYWGYVNGCGPTRQASTFASCEDHPNCTSGKPVTWCPVSGPGHNVWSQAAKTSWAFFKTL